MGPGWPGLVSLYEEEKTPERSFLERKGHVKPHREGEERPLEKPTLPIP